MMVRVQTDQAVPYVEAAAELLRVAWRRPCLHYTSSYLYWQFTYPASRPAMAVVVRDGRQLVGFGAMIPRRMRFAGRPVDVNHVTFVCVRPDLRGAGLGAAIYRAIFAEVAASGRPFVAFTLTRSTSERTLRLSAEDAGFSLRSMGEYAVHGYLHRPGAPMPEGPERVAPARIDDDEARALIHAVGDDGRTLGIQADPETMSHWSRDPRRSATLLVRRDGRLLGGAMLVRGQISTHKGVDPVTSIERLILPDGDTDAFVALVRGAGAFWAEGDGAEFVSLANLRDVPDAAIRAAGVRQTPTRFAAHLGFPPGCDPGSLAGAVATNMAIS